MALSAAQRYQLNLLGVPDGTLADADLYALAGVIQAESSAPTSLTEAQRYQLNLMGVPDSSFAVGDRFALAGVVETAISTGAIIQTFDVTWNMAPTWSLVLSSATGLYDMEMAPFTFYGEGTSRWLTAPEVYAWGVHVTMHNNPLTNVARITDEASGVVRFGGFKAAQTWMLDKLTAKVNITLETTPLLARSVQFKDNACFSTKITDIVAARTRTPGT